MKENREELFCNYMQCKSNFKKFMNAHSELSVGEDNILIGLEKMNVEDLTEFKNLNDKLHKSFLKWNS